MARNLPNRCRSAIIFQPETAPISRFGHGRSHSRHQVKENLSTIVKQWNEHKIVEHTAHSEVSWCPSSLKRIDPYVRREKSEILCHFWPAWPSTQRSKSAWESTSFERSICLRKSIVSDKISIQISPEWNKTFPFLSVDSMVHPFVEVSFQKSSARTTAGNGTSPTWNQELCLPVKYFSNNNSFQKVWIRFIKFYSFSEGIRSLAYLQSIRDDLFIQLFDEVSKTKNESEMGMFNKNNQALFME